MNQPIDNFSLESTTGFRLLKLEVLNWGTFTYNSWKIKPNGRNSLLTGDIGSGKSTLVDAITTLLVPYNKITYNKAAGAENDERSLTSYLKGQYGNIQDANTKSTKPQYVRENYEEKDYSVLLCYFFNEAYKQDVTLSQVFWMRNGKPEKFFVLGDVELTINKDFSNFGTEINQLKKRLRKTSGIEVFDSFTEYSNRFRQVFGIKTEQALDLFYRTASMKSVPNLTEFVRQQMLEKTDIKSKIEDLKKRFDDLTEAYNSVQKAKNQIEFLEPMMKDIQEFENILLEIEELKVCLEIIPKYFASQKIDLLKEDLYSLNDEYQKNVNNISLLTKRLSELRTQQENIRQAAESSEPFQRLNQITSKTSEKTLERDKRIAKNSEYVNLLKKLELPAFISEENFYSTVNNIRDLQGNLSSEEQSLTNERDDSKILLSKNTDLISELSLEIESLKLRKSQIPDINLRLRSMVLNDLELTEDDLPFVGELVKVKDTDKEWEGAIERLLHNFALSILVPEDLYKRVSNYVDKTHLKGRLVYYRLLDHENKRGYEVGKNSLLNKIEIKEDCDFYDWLDIELQEKFNYNCCESIEDFHRELYAITKQGQIKSGKIRHEKNDRTNILDRKNYVLGWSNKAKIDAITSELEGIKEQSYELENNIKSIENLQKKLSEKILAIHDLLKFKDYTEINWQDLAAEIKNLEDEAERLKNSSNELSELNQQLEKVNKQIAETDDEKSNLIEIKGITINKINTSAQNLYTCLDKLNLFLKIQELINFFESTESIHNNLEVWIKELYDQINGQYYLEDHLVSIINKYLTNDNLYLRNIDTIEKKTLDKITSGNGLIAVKTEDEKKVRDRIVRQMQKYKNEYPGETTEVDAKIDSRNEFKQYYDNLVQDDLPRHESKFKQLLKEGTIQSIALFQNQLEIYEKNILKKISEINKSLKDINYTETTYIRIIEDVTQDAEIRDFKTDIKKCLENTFGEEDFYTEEKYIQVKAILDRFRSVEDSEKKWTDKVTDVRQWYTFGASERWREDDQEKEFYSDSSGKSGGQKEKLAYTVLASALAYQFGLDWDDKKSRSFRFAVIDEAFGRGSDESTRYGLELFKKLNLQLLIVTPLQKINIIENYINSVHFVSNPTGKNSMVRDLSINQYEIEKDKYFSKIEQHKTIS